MKPEDALQAGCVEYLYAALPSDAWFAAIPNGAALKGGPRQRAIQMNRLKKTGLRVGAPDLIIVHRGRLLAFELKVDTDQSQSQRDTALLLAKAGVAYYVIRSLDELIIILKAEGVTHDRA